MTPTNRLYFNNSLGVLASPLERGDATIDFGTAPANFPSIADPDYIPLVIEPPVGNTPSENFEIVWLVEYNAGDTTGTVERGMDGTTSPFDPDHVAGVAWLCGPLAADATSGEDEAWTSFTPTWTTSGSEPSIGNGTLIGYYTLIGKTCFFKIWLLAGSSTNGGSGAFTFSLPVAAKSGSGEQHVLCKGYTGGGSPANSYAGLGVIYDGADTVSPFLPTDPDSSVQGNVSNSSPNSPSMTSGFAFNESGNLFIGGAYETA